MLKEDSGISDRRVKFSQGGIKMRNRYSIIFTCIAIVSVQMSIADVTTVDGIPWTYTVQHGEASIGGGSFSSTAVPTSTVGIITIPLELNGYPVTSIGNEAFFNCRELTNITIPSSVTKIGSSAFTDCSSMTNITIPSSVKEIGEAVFCRCRGLKEILVDAASSVYKSEDGLLLSKDGTTLVSVPGGMIGSLLIPSGVKYIGNYAFYYCSQLTNVVFPNDMTSIGRHAFTDCSNLENVIIPNSVTNIGASAFVRTGLISIDIPSSITIIGVGTFASCSRLKRVMIPGSVAIVEERAFANSGLETIVFKGNAPTMSGSDHFRDVPSSCTAYVVPSSRNWNGRYPGNGKESMSTI